MKSYKKVLKIILNVFIWIFVVFSVFVTVLALAAQSNSDNVPSLGGTNFLTVSSDSMAPTFEKGDLIFGKTLTTEQKNNLKVDDVITFYSDLDGDGNKELNTHRIVSVNLSDKGEVISYVTKGDNPNTNAVADSDPVEWQFVVSKWNGKKIANVGGFLAFLQTPKGFLVTIVIPLFLFFLYELFVFIKTLLDIKSNKAKETTQNNSISKEQEEDIKKKAIEEFLRQQQLKNDVSAPSDNPQNNVADENVPAKCDDDIAPHKDDSDI